jgi:hypothetical protein
MRLEIKVTLDSGGYILVRGEDLTAEGVHEVFDMLSNHRVESFTLPLKDDQ